MHQARPCIRGGRASLMYRQHRVARAPPMLCPTTMRLLSALQIRIQVRARLRLEQGLGLGPGMSPQHEGRARPAAGPWTTPCNMPWTMPSGPGGAPPPFSTPDRRSLEEALYLGTQGLEGLWRIHWSRLSCIEM